MKKKKAGNDEKGMWGARKQVIELPFEQRLEERQGGTTCTSFKEDSRPRWCHVPKSQGKYWYVQERPRGPDGRVVAAELR